MLQRLRCWVENFGFLFVLAIFAVVAMVSFQQLAISNWQLANLVVPAAFSSSCFLIFLNSYRFHTQANC
jgi:hypothetical protein